MRIPKLRGFRNPFKVEYEVVNVGRISALVAAGRLEPAEAEAPKSKAKAAKSAPITVNQEVLRATGLVSTLKRPLKVLGGGDVDVALFVVADAVTRSARAKIEAAGGSVQLLEVPGRRLQAIGVEPAEASAVGAPSVRAERPADEPLAEPAAEAEPLADGPVAEHPAEEPLAEHPADEPLAEPELLADTDAAEPESDTSDADA
jgi:ribosomal protein L15